MPIDFARAVAFVRERGNEFDNARLDDLLGEGAVLSAEQEQRFFAEQRADGGWAPFWAQDYSSLDATCFRLAQGENLIDPWNPGFGHAAHFFRTRQGPDGSWEEDELVRELAPPWAVPGELAPRLYLTANCGWWVAHPSFSGGFVTGDEAATRAGAYLEQHVAQDGSLPSLLQTHWLAAGLWLRLGRDDVANCTLDHLGTRIDDSVPSGALAWMLTTLAGVSIEPEHLLIRKATESLMSQQRADGSWASEDGPDRDAYVTAEALRGLTMWYAV